MQESLLTILRCPITRSSFQLKIISTGKKWYNHIETTYITEGVLWGNEGLFYPIINGIPRLIVEALLDYETFFRTHLPDFDQRKNKINPQHLSLIQYAAKKNASTKKSFELEWSQFRYEEDKTWDADRDGMIERFLKETDETREQLKDKTLFDVGCGNGLLDSLIASYGTKVLAMDFSKSIEKAFEKNTQPNVFFIQGDLQYPPVAPQYFDIVHCSGVLICTNNTESSFGQIDTCVKKQGKLSVWLYQPRKDIIHNLFNFIRNYTSKLPLTLQYYLYKLTIFPLSFIIKRLKGNKQNPREMMIDILDWFTPEFRWEHTPEEAKAWYEKRNYSNIKVTTNEMFGFNMVGEKN
jgi:SAM-dependent methyltransferase/uncharacterized protein YbaR (Trm112 family)